MKRLRDDGSTAGSQFKRPFAASRVDLSLRCNRTGGGGGKKLTTEHALQYLKEVRDMFHDRMDKYDQFLEVMKDYKAQSIDTKGVAARVKELFNGHDNLIYGFNTFLPMGYKITLDDNDAPPKKAIEFEQAISFVNKIKTRFQNDYHVYKAFLDVLNLYKKERKNVDEVREEVSQLFEDHADLVDEFTRFLPENSLAVSGHHAQGRTNFQSYYERNLAMPPSWQMLFDKRRLLQDKFSASRAVCNVSIEHLDHVEDKAMLEVNKDSKKREKDNGDRRKHDQDDRDPEYDIKKDPNIQHCPDKLKPSRKDGFGLMASTEDKSALKSMYNQEFIFCEKVKEKLGSSEDYQAFLKCLYIYSTAIINRNELQSLVVNLFGKHSDLIEGFNEFLEHCENIDGFLAGLMNKKSLWDDGGHGHLSRSIKVDDKDKESKPDVEGAKAKDINKEKYMDKSIQELDLSNCQQCTPSYRLLPDDYPIVTASQRSQIGAQVLNDHWVSVTSGSEDYSFKHMRRNLYEENLFRCEDDRFELDMLLASVKSTVKRVEDLLNGLNNKTINLDCPFRIEDHFNAVNLMCIERLYSDHGLDMLDLLRKNPSPALPVIVTRLKQKEDEWTNYRSDFNKVWVDVYSKNHYKSLDHRSFYFKQQDSKNLGLKSLVAEIKEIKENLQKEDDMLLAIAAGNRRPLVPHLALEYIDIDIHEDLYKLVQFSSEELCNTREQFTKVMRLWTTFLEPMLGVTSELHRTDGANGIIKDKNQSARCGATDIVESDGIPGSDANANFKQQRLEDGGDVSALPEVPRPSRPNMANGHTAHMELDSGDSKSTAHVEKVRNDAGTSEEVPGLNTSCTSSPAVKSSNSRGRINIGIASGWQSTVPSPASVTEENHRSKSNFDSLRSPEDVASEPTTLANGSFSEAAKVHGSKVDKEEGELSPYGDCEEVRSIADGDCGSVDGLKTGDGGVATADDGIDSDDKEDSENASEAGEVSGSESAGDECSREEQEVEDYDGIDDKAQSEYEVDGIDDMNYSGGDGTQLPLTEGYSTTAKPLSSAAQSTSSECSRVFYGNDNFYALFRLHHTLYKRIRAAKLNSASSETKWRSSKDLSSLHPCASFMDALYDLLQGVSDNAKFEDDCRAFFGNQSYLLFTLDELIYKLFKQLQMIVTDEMDNKLLQLFEYEKSRKLGRFTDSVYHENARILLRHENIYRVDCSSPPAMLSIQLMDGGYEKPEIAALPIHPNFASYLYNEFLSIVSNKKDHHGIMIQRNTRQYAALDDLSAMATAMDGAQIINGLQCIIACHSSKISYVNDTEDFFLRPRKKRINLSADLCARINQARVQRFHRICSQDS